MVWYSFGITHVVRVEDFPVMPIEVTGFALKPFGFFTRSPCVDLPASKNEASVETAGGAACCGTNGTNGTHGTNGTNGTNGHA